MSASASAISRLLALGGELALPAPGQPRRKFDLAHMRILLEALGDPHRRFPSVLIAGTNGKGSTAATLASILQAGGSRVGLYTSPHLERPNERIRISDDMISDDALACRFEQVEAASARLLTEQRLPYAPSFFETFTAIAFLQFAAASGCGAEPSNAVDIAILEVGMGGRLDATNVVDPILSILTDISLDHQEWLGNTVAAITREKAGILRPRGTLVTLPQHPEANQVIGEVAVPLEVNAISAADYLPLREIQHSGEADSSLQLRNRYSITLPKPVSGGSVVHVDSPLAGEHQRRNLAIAICAALTLHQQARLPLSLSALEGGIRGTRWPGRMQLLRPPKSQAGTVSVLLDAAHNPAGAWALRAALSSIPVAGPRALVFGCMADKPIEELAQILFPVLDRLYLTRSTSTRAASLEQLAHAAALTGSPCRSFDNVPDALGSALADTSNGLVVGAGSVALVGEMSQLLQGWT